jgi:hypothetical protein
MNQSKTPVTNKNKRKRSVPSSEIEVKHNIERKKNMKKKKKSKKAYKPSSSSSSSEDEGFAKPKSNAMAGLWSNKTINFVDLSFPLSSDHDENSRTSAGGSHKTQLTVAEKVLSQACGIKQENVQFKRLLRKSH